MALGDIIGKVTGMMGNDFDFAAKLQELGVEPSMLENLDIEAAKAFIEEKGFDLSMLDSLGLDLDALIEKFKGEA